MTKRNPNLTEAEVQAIAAATMQKIYEHEGSYQAIADRVAKELGMESLTRQAAHVWCTGKIGPMRAVHIARAYADLGIKFSDLRPDFAGVE